MSGIWITCAERREMQEWRDAGLTVKWIASFFGCTPRTVRRHTVDTGKGAEMRRKSMAIRNAHLEKAVKGRSHVERDVIARQYGFKSASSLKVVLCEHRKSLRAHTEATAA
jgi:IS30 family transposase